MAKAKKISVSKIVVPEIEPVEIPIRIVLNVEYKSDNATTIPPDNFLTSFIPNNIEAEQVATEVKIIILAIIGNKTIKPQDLPEGDRLEEDLGYDSSLLDFLHIALNNYVHHKKPGAKISQQEMDRCKTVGDCIDLVKGKI